MGLFSRFFGGSDHWVTRLVESANGNVTEKVLTKDREIINTYLYDEPLVTYVKKDEQPEYVISHATEGYRIKHQDGKEYNPHDEGVGKKYLLVTDQRVLYVAGCSTGDETIEHSYDEIVEAKKDETDIIQVHTTDHKIYNFPSALHATDSEDRQEAVNYISARATGTIDEEDESENLGNNPFKHSSKDNLRGDMNDLL